MLKLAALIAICISSAQAQVEIKLTDLDGRTAEYEHKYSTHLTSDRGVQLAYGAGDEVDIEVLGSWKSQETRAVNDSGVVVSTTVIKDGDSWAKQNGRKLTFEQYPFNIGQMNDESYSWELTPGGVKNLKPDFRPWSIRQRTDTINELAMVWFPGIMPVLPDGPVKEGDTWEGESTVERRFYKLGAGDKSYKMTISSKYEVKKIEEKKGNAIVEIREEREIDYTGWVEVVSFSVLLEEGSGSGSADWEIDATNGVVTKCEYKMNVNRPLLRTYGAEYPVPDAESNYLMVYDSQLKKLK